MPSISESRGILSTGFSGMATWWMVFAIVATEVVFSAPTSTIHYSADDTPDEATSPRLPCVETGSMHTARAAYMSSHRHVRLLTVASPVKVVRRRRVTWTMDVWALGEYGESYNMMIMKPLGSYDEASWNGTFPCVLVRGSGRTSCRGTLPAGADCETWRLPLDAEDARARWDGTFPHAPEIPLGEPESFVGNMTCESLSGLVLARVIQRRGRYVGEANVTCQSASTFVYVIVDGPGVHFQMRINAADKRGDGEKTEEGDGGDGRGVVVTKRLSWKSGVDSLGRLVISDGLRTVAYAKDVLSGD